MSAALLHPVFSRTTGQEADRPPAARVASQSSCARHALALSGELSGAGEDLVFEKDSEDVPLPSRNFYWSVSHDAEWVAAVVHDAPVGIDLERITKRRSELVEPVLSNEERALLGTFDWRLFMRVWTAKEAVLKRAGIGLGELSRCRLAARPGERSMTLAHRGSPCLVQQYFQDDHVFSVHTLGEDWTVRWPVEA